MTPNKLPPLPEHWSVEVRANGQGVLTIESNCLSGRDLSEQDEATIENCAQHLLAFLGRRTEALRQSQSLPAGAVAEVTRWNWSWKGHDVGQMCPSPDGGYVEYHVHAAVVNDHRRRLVEIERENLEGWKQAAHWRAKAEALQADAREKGEAVDVERFRELPAKWLHERAEMASARRGHNPHNEGIIATLDRCARELEARLIATQPAQASEKDNG